MQVTAPLVCSLAALLSVLPLSETAVPGTFFWKPRVGLDIDQSKKKLMVKKPTWEHIHEGFVVIVDGYQLGVTVAALASYVGDVSAAFPHLHPGMAPYYTNMYRWALRHLSLLPEWFGAKSGQNYVNTHRVWKKRFHFVDYFVPSWIRKLLFFVKDESWAYEEWEWKKFRKHAEPHFGKYYLYPSKKFDDYKSMRHNITIENQDFTDNSISTGKL